ncbi:MAG: hypothetical protein GF344_00255 [Chitinivibrionales bacterium]|nr:hypothetical protein [Chitinivibrionales bacterium]
MVDVKKYQEKRGRVLGWMAGMSVVVSLGASAIDAAAPQAPSNFYPHARSTTSIELFWDDNSDDEIGFRIYRTTIETYSDTEKPSGPIATVSGTSYLDNDAGPMDPGSDYFRYWVEAYNSDGTSASVSVDAAPHFSDVDEWVAIQCKDGLKYIDGFYSGAGDPNDLSMTTEIDDFSLWGKFAYASAYDYVFQNKGNGLILAAGDYWNGKVANYCRNDAFYQEIDQGDGWHALYNYDHYEEYLTKINDNQLLLNETITDAGQWRYVSLDTYRLKSKSTGYFLCPEADVAGSAITVDIDDGTDWFRWIKVANGDHFHLKHAATGMFFQPTTSSDGSLLELVDASEDGNWTQWSDVASGDGATVFLKNKATEKHVRPEINSPGTYVQQQPSSWTGDWTRWEYMASEPAPDAVYTIRNLATDRHLNGNGSGNTAQMVPKSWTGNFSKWHKEMVDDTYFRLKCVGSGKYLTASPCETNGAAIEMTENAESAAEWRLTRIGAAFKLDTRTCTSNPYLYSGGSKGYPTLAPNNWTGNHTDWILTDY